MQYKNYNSYNIIHKNGESEKINAESMEQALAFMSTPETESPVMRAIVTQTDICTLVQDLPDEIYFTAVVDPDSVASGSIATPSEGTIHVGDEIALKAIPARNYEFVSWSRNGEVISTEAELVYTMTPLLEGEDSAVFSAKFRLADVTWTTGVEPAEATGAGCIAFPSSGSTVAKGKAEFLAVAAEGYTFNHWERNGVSLSENKLLELDAVVPLAPTETKAVYTAVFTKN